MRRNKTQFSLSTALSQVRILAFFVNVLIYFILPAVGLAFWSYLAGNTKGVGTTDNIATRINDIYNEFKDKCRAGFFMSVAPSLLITDPELAKTILIKDFSSFHDHGTYYNERDDPLSAHLFNIEGEKWKFFRDKLSPTFTSEKLKMMYSSIHDVGDRFIEALDKFAKERKPFDAKHMSQKFTTDMVGSTAFGIDINCLNNDEAFCCC